MPKDSFAVHTPATLKNLATQIRESATLIDAAAEAMKALEIREMTVPRRNSIEVGMDSIDSFCVGLREAVRSTAASGRVPAGDTGTEGKGLRVHKAPRKPPKGDT